jgi:D-lactate dehydrogenase
MWQADTPSRFNADQRRLHEASGSAGKLAVFAVRVDTFAKPQSEQVFYVGTNDPEQLNVIRTRLLSECQELPRWVSICIGVGSTARIITARICS